MKKSVKENGRNYKALPGSDGVARGFDRLAAASWHGEGAAFA
jgi:hypothetical protein